VSSQSAAEGRNPPQESKIRDPYLRATLAVIYHSPDLDLSADDQAVLHQLIRFSRKYQPPRQVYPSRKKLASHAGMSPYTVRDVSKRLREKGLIRWRTCGVPGKQSKRCVYDITGVMKWASSPDVVAAVKKAMKRAYDRNGSSEHTADVGSKEDVPLEHTTAVGSEHTGDPKEKRVSTKRVTSLLAQRQVADAPGILPSAPPPYWEKQNDERLEAMNTLRAIESA